MSVADSYPSLSVGSLNNSCDLLCSECMLPFSHRSKLNRHIREQHSSKPPITCQLCHSTFKRVEHLTRHNQLVHQQKKLQCEFCFARAVDPSRLRRHYRVAHKAFACGDCSFVSKGTVQHVCDKPKFPCPTCGKTYRRQSYLSLHKCPRSGENPQVLSEPAPDQPKPLPAKPKEKPGNFLPEPKIPRDESPIFQPDFALKSKEFLCGFENCLKVFPTQRKMKQHWRRHRDRKKHGEADAV